MIRQLALPAGFAFPALVRDIAAQDSMHDGRDAHYLAVGQSALDCILRALRGRVPRRILDLPCGYGRVTRFLRARFPQAQITVCDLDRASVAFCAAGFSARPVHATEQLNQLQLPGRYDLIWVGSLITHLSCGQSRALLAKLEQALTRAGVIVASSHGPSIADGLRDWGYGLEPPDAARLLRDYGATGYGHRGYDGGAGYGISLSDRLFWAEHFSRGALALAGYEAQAWDGHQDILILRRRARFARQPGGNVPDESELLAARRAASAHDAALAAFDAEVYLAENPDVAAAVQAGHFASAFRHYWERGRFEGRDF